MSGAAVQQVRPSNGRYMRLEDIIKKAVISYDVHKCPTQVISIENTADGSIVPLDEMKRISEWARRHGIKLHLDGARLWEAVAAGAGSLKDYCTLCDLVCLDFSKNLGGTYGCYGSWGGGGDCAVEEGQEEYWGCDEAVWAFSCCCEDCCG